MFNFIISNLYPIDLDILSEHKIILSIIILFISAIWISFSGLLVWRLPVICGINWCNWTKNRQETTIMGRSHCDSCDRKLTPIDLIPVIGWLINKGKCPSCHHKISIAWPIMELIGGLLSVGIFFLPISFHNQIIIWLLFLSLILISWMDDKSFWIPDTFTFPLIFAGLLFSPIEDINSRVIGFAVYWFVLLICLLWICWKKGSFEFLSWGDIIFAGAAGSWLGFDNLSFFLGGSVVFGIIYILYKKFIDKNTEYTEDESHQMQIPFAPPMSASLIIILISVLIFNISII